MIIHWLYEYILIPITTSISFGMPMAAAFMVSAGIYASIPGSGRKWLAALIGSSAINAFFAFIAGAFLFKGSFTKGFVFLIVPMIFGICFGYSEKKREKSSVQ